MRIKETKVYPFDELSEDAQEKAIENLWDINIWSEWYDSTYEDAAQIKLKLTEFDIGRDSYCRGEFIEYAEDTAKAIIQNHRACCPTHETAIRYNHERDLIKLAYPEDLDGNNENEWVRKTAQDESDNEFLENILEDYRIILQKEYEYLISSETIVETIKANEYEFTENGQLA